MLAISRNVELVQRWGGALRFGQRTSPISRALTVAARVDYHSLTGSPAVGLALGPHAHFHRLRRAHLPHAAGGVPPVPKPPEPADAADLGLRPVGLRSRPAWAGGVPDSVRAACVEPRPFGLALV